MYSLSNLAAEDLKKIYEYTLVNFGAEKADKYTDSLKRVLELIADQPSIGLECQEIKKGLMRHTHQKHSVFYVMRQSSMFVLRILHQQMKPPSFIDRR